MICSCIRERPVHIQIYRERQGEQEKQEKEGKKESWEFAIWKKKPSAFWAHSLLQTQDQMWDAASKIPAKRIASSKYPSWALKQPRQLCRCGSITLQQRLKEHGPLLADRQGGLSAPNLTESFCRRQKAADSIASVATWKTLDANTWWI